MATYAEIVEYLSKRAENLKCPACGHVNWSVSEEAAAKVWLSATDAESESWRSSGTRFLPVISLICLTCGHVMFFAQKFVDLWLKKRAGNDK